MTEQEIFERKLLAEWAEAAGVHFVNRSYGQATTQPVSRNDLLQLIRAAALRSPADQGEKGWQPEDTAPEGESVLIYMRLVDAVDMAHKADTGRWIAGSGTIWPPGVITHWQRLPAPPAIDSTKGSGELEGER